MTKQKTKYSNEGMFGLFYCTAVVGAAVYFVQHSDGFWGFILAILKGFVWPAFLIHRGFELLFS